MEPLKTEEKALMKCLLCDVSTPSKYELTQHIHRHLAHRKYQCSSCTELFYTEEEREVHCLERGHIHLYGMKVSAYCELYVNMLLRDAEYAFHNGTEAAVMQRTKANLGCNFVENSTSEILPTDVHNGDALLGRDQLLPRVSEKLSASHNQKTSTEISNGDTTDATSTVTISLRDVPLSRTSVGVCQETFPWGRLPRGLQLKILQNLSRSDLDNCQLVNREMSELIRCNERLMKRRLIEYVGIRYQSLLYLNCSEKGVSKVIDLKTYCTIREASDSSKSTDQSALEPLWLRSLITILHTVLRKADILHLEIDEDTVPIGDSILFSLTATDFCIESRNEITYDGMKSFAERLISGKQNVIRGIFSSGHYSHAFQRYSIELKNAGLKLSSVSPYLLVVSTELLKTEKRSYLDDFTNSSFMPCYL